MSAPGGGTLQAFCLLPRTLYLLLRKEPSKPNARLPHPKSKKGERTSVIGIIVQEHEPIDRALRRFKKKYERAGILKEFRRRTSFEKPSITNKLLRQRAARRQLRQQEEAA